MVDIHHEGSAKAPLAVAFAYIDDYRTTPQWMFGLADFQPIGDQDQGLDAVFDGTFQVKPVKLHSTVKITAWEQDKLIRMESIKGFVNRSTWRFEAAGDTETKITVDFTYKLPGGLAGRAMGKATPPCASTSKSVTPPAAEAPDVGRGVRVSCLFAALAALLALAVPASIAPASLIGAYVVIVLLALLALTAVAARSRRPREAPRPLLPDAMRVGVVAIAYAVVVTAIHAAA
jgi:ribosome-associated toxin RatA of RatAB toxin-antitoxin module